MFLLLKKIIFWTYGRTTWQYDVLCALILAFIFLTPKSWFDMSERMRCAEHQKIPAVSTLLPPAPGRTTAKLPAMTSERTGGGRVFTRPGGSGAGMMVAYRVDIK